MILKKFLMEWLAWAEADTHGSYILDPQHGLCDNFSLWLGCSSYREEACSEQADKLSKLLAEDFPEEDILFPFGRDQYYKDVDGQSHHKNEYRLAWVRAKIKQLPDEEA